MPPPAATVGLWIALAFPSCFIVMKYLGAEGAIAYGILVALVLARQPRLPERLSVRDISWLALIMFLVTVAIFSALYPLANTHVPGSGSDDDDSLNTGVMALLRGHSPYAYTSYLGNVLHHLPGAFVIAAPFVLLGTSALQNLFWLPLFFLAVKEERDSRTALQLACLVLTFSPAVIYEVVTGTGYVSNTIYVLLGLRWLARSRHRDIASVAWGVALASRANFLFLVPLAFGWLAQHAGWRVAMRATVLTCVTAASVTVPFYLHDPANFGPLFAADRLLRFDLLLPHLGVALLAVMAAMSVALSFTTMDTGALFRNCAVVQAFPVVAGVVLSSVLSGRFEPVYTRYGPFFAWFALMAIVTGSSIPREQALRGQLVDEREKVGL